MCLYFQHHDDDEDNDADNESDSPTPPPPIHVIHEYNGDSGYEAESKPDEEEETLMNDSDPGDKLFQEQTTPHNPVTYDTDTSLTPSSPESKNSNFVSENVSPVSHSDDVSLGKVSQLSNNSDEDCKVINYGFPNTPVIELGPDSPLNKPSIVLNGGNDT